MAIWYHRRGKIRTENVFPPIPQRDFDWSAVLDDEYEPGQPIGFGRSEVEAIRDLIAQLPPGLPW